MQDLAVADRIATLTLDRPPANAINDAWVAAFHARLDELAARDDWTLLHVRSRLRLFSAGADLKDMRERYGTPEGRAAFQVGVRGMQVLFQRIDGNGKPSGTPVGAYSKDYFITQNSKKGRK